MINAYSSALGDNIISILLAEFSFSILNENKVHFIRLIIISSLLNLFLIFSNIYSIYF